MGMMRVRRASRRLACASRDFGPYISPPGLSEALMPTLLDLPAVVLGGIAQGLTSKEILRFLFLVCKSLSDGGALDAGFWSRALMERLRKFRPANLYYDGPDNSTNDSLRGLTGRDRFPDQAETCEDRLANALEDAEIGDVTWVGEWRTLRTFNAVARSFHISADVVLPHDLAQVIANHSITQEHYARFVRRFECEHCGEDAQRQCAGCGDLLCLPCSVRCGEDRPRLDTEGPYAGGPSIVSRVYTVTLPTFYPFVVCQACDESFSLAGEHAYRDKVFAMEDPGLSPHVCLRCPPNKLFCPAHIDCCILECTRCEDRACMDHCADEPTLFCCSICYWTLCLDYTCQRDERRMLHCIELKTGKYKGCMSCYCSDCCPSEICPKCGTPVIE